MPPNPTPDDRFSQHLDALQQQVDELTKAVGRFGGVVRDAKDNVLITPDPVTGTGLGRPYLPLPFVTNNATQWNFTTSSTEVAMTSCRFYKQHPQIVVVVAVYCDAGTTGAAHMKLNNAVVTADAAAVAGFNTFTFGPLAVPGAHEDIVLVDVWAWRTGGTGTVYCHVSNAWAVQT